MVVRERGWWWQLHRWAVNDVAPGVPHPSAGRTSSNRGWLNKRVLRVLQEVCVAKDSQDYSRVKFMQPEPQSMSQQLNVPLSLTSSVVVPNVTTSQKTALCRVLRRILRSANMLAWQRQAYFCLVRVVRSSPHKLHKVFDQAARAANLVDRKPVCYCHAQRGMLEGLREGTWLWCQSLCRHPMVKYCDRATACQ